ncbi:MAG: trypsin-like peptidase domain-containing protein, partial [Chloroflexi bacterium]|nr:trypsin-like peptidase domain-containing protein [Chloroflexota bacterium]
DDRTFDARLIGRDPQTDLAVIKIDGTNLPTAPLGNSDTLKIGEWVVAIGNALGLEGGPTVTVGVVGALNRSLEEPTGAGLYDLIQTDAPINPGNSGGPLVNLNGEVVGVNTAVARSPVGGQAAGIGFSIAVNSAKPISDQIIANGRVIRPYLGIAPITVTAALASRYDLPVQKGVVIARVDRTTPAGRAGLLVGDVIVDIDGQKIGNERDLRRALERKRPGETARVTVVRENGQQAQVNVTLGETPRS